MEAAVGRDGDERFDGGTVRLGIKIVRRKELQVVLEEFAFRLYGLHNGDRVALHSEKRIEIQIERRELVAFAAIEAGVGRDQVPHLVVGHKLVGNEVLDVVAAHVEAFAGVDAIHSALAVKHEVPKPLFMGR